MDSDTRKTDYGRGCGFYFSVVSRFSNRDCKSAAFVAQKKITWTLPNNTKK